MKTIIIFLTSVFFISCTENLFNKEFLTFELRLAESDQSSNLTEMVLYKSEQKFFIHDSIFLQNKEIASTEVIDWQTHPKVLITLTDTGREKFTDFTLNNIGKIAAIIVDNKLVSAPRINAQINEGKLIIVGVFNHAEAQSISEGILTKKSSE